MLGFIGELLKGVGGAIGGLIISLGGVLGFSQPVVVEEPTETVTVNQQQGTTTESAVTEREDIKKQSQPVYPPATVNSPAPTITTQKNTQPTDFTAKCSITKPADLSVSTGNYVTVRVDIMDGRNQGLEKDFNFAWSSTGGELKNTEGKTTTLLFNEPGDFDVRALVTKIATGGQLTATCRVHVSCDDYECMSNREKMIVKLNDIIYVIKGWYKSTDVLYSCSLAESVVRAIEYDYTLLGGKNLPAFDKTVDCASPVAPAAYQYKIQALRDSL